MCHTSPRFFAWSSSLYSSLCLFTFAFLFAVLLLIKGIINGKGIEQDMFLLLGQLQETCVRHSLLLLFVEDDSEGNQRREI